MRSICASLVFLIPLWMGQAHATADDEAPAGPGATGEAEAAAPALPRWHLPEPAPAAVKRLDRTPREVEPIYHRSPPARSVPPTLKVAPGTAVGLAGDVRGQWAFLLDTSLSAWAEVERGLGARWALFPELGYSLAVDGDAITHLGAVGLGPGLRFRHLCLQLIPRFLIGARRGHLALGVRTALGVHLGDDATIGLELGHRYVWTRRGQGQQMELVLSFDLLGFLFLLDEEVRW